MNDLAVQGLALTLGAIGVLVPTVLGAIGWWAVVKEAIRD